MKCKGYIWFFILSLCTSVCIAQPLILDTICEWENPSHLLVPQNEGSHYEWSVKGGTIIAGAGTHDITIQWDGAPGYYVVSVVETNEHGCTGEANGIVVFRNNFTNMYIHGPEKVCYGQEVKLVGEAGNDFIWSGGERVQSVSFIPQKDTTVFIASLNGPCRNDTIFHKIKVSPSPRANMLPLPDTVYINTDVELIYTGADADRVVWYEDEDDIGEAFYMSHQFQKAGTYRIMQKSYRGACECLDTISESIIVIDDFKVHIPNAFTPNGDGKNDRFIFKGVGIKSYRATIHNRWGEQIFAWDSNSSVKGWDGTVAGVDATVDTYVYKIVVRDYRGVEHPFLGHVSVIR